MPAHKIDELNRKFGGVKWLRIPLVIPRWMISVSTLFLMLELLSFRKNRKSRCQFHPFINPILDDWPFAGNYCWIDNQRDTTHCFILKIHGCQQLIGIWKAIHFCEIVVRPNCRRAGVRANRNIIHHHFSLWGNTDRFYNLRTDALPAYKYVAFFFNMMM